MTVRDRGTRTHSTWLRVLGLGTLLTLGACRYGETSSCRADSDCKAWETCDAALGNVCWRQACTADAQCRAGALCAESHGECVSAVPFEGMRPCETACQGGEVCLDGACMAPEAPVCAPECHPWQVCTAGNCQARFSGVGVEAPAAGATFREGSVAIVARLEGGEEGAPTELSWRALGTQQNEVARGRLVRNDSGRYVGSWSLPVQEGRYALTVGYEEAGLTSAPVEVVVDKTAPVFTLVVEAWTPPDSVPGTTYEEPGHEGAWPRDAVLPVRVMASAADVEPSSVKLTAHGHAGGVDLADIEVTPAEGCGAAWCGQALVPLWKPGLETFRGKFELVVSGKDRAGNEARGQGEVKVTRFKWEVDASGDLPIQASPAVGRKGTLYFVSGGGKLLGVKPDGTRAWNELHVGVVRSGLSVGEPIGDSERVYLAAETSREGSAGAALYAIDGATGTSEHACFAAGATAPVATALMTTVLNGADLETVVTVLKGTGTGTFLRKRDSGWQCQGTNLNEDSPEPSEGTAGSALAMKGTDFFYGTGDERIVRFELAGTSPLWSATTSDEQYVYGLALSDTDIVGGGGLAESKGGLYLQSAASSGNVTTSPLPGTAGARVTHLSVGAGGTKGIAYFGAEKSGGGDLKRVDLGAPTTNPRSVADTGAIPMAPVLGKGGLIYTASSSGTGIIAAWDAATLAPKWSLTGKGKATASPTLDCSRDSTGKMRPGAPGVLYVPVGGKLLALVVDSAGIDTSAPWPKFQRDPRNTGNADTELSQFACE